MPKDHTDDKQQWNDSRCLGNGWEMVIWSQMMVINGNAIESEQPALVCYTSGTSTWKGFFYYIFYVNELVLPKKWI